MWIEVDYGLVNLDNIECVRAISHGSNDFYMIEIVSGNNNITYGSYQTIDEVGLAIKKIGFALKKNQVLFKIPTADELSDTEEKAKIEKKQPCMSMEEAINLWNTLADRGFKQVSRRGENTKSGKMLKARLLEYTKEQWEQAIANIRKSDVLQRNQEKWFDFDWFVCPSNFPKVLDGKYNDSATDHMEKTEKEWWEK